MNVKSESWIDLKPLKVKHGNIEPFEGYISRIKSRKEFSHIPEIVFEQWLWAHHDKEESIINYGWLNYKNVRFELCRWANKQFVDIYIIKKYRSYYELRASYDDITSFACTKKDLDKWKNDGTWRTPPIILDVKSIKDEIPSNCELVSPYQLVEGHSRLGYLHSMFFIDRLGKEKIAESHEVFLMSIEN